MTRSTWCLLICIYKVTLTALSPGPKDTPYTRLELASFSARVPWDMRPELASSPKKLLLKVRQTGESLHSHFLCTYGARNTAVTPAKMTLCSGTLSNCFLTAFQTDLGAAFETRSMTLLCKLTMDEKTGRKRVAVATLLVHSVKTAIISESTDAVAHGGIEPSGVIWRPSQAESPECWQAKEKKCGFQWGLEHPAHEQRAHVMSGIPIK